MTVSFESKTLREKGNDAFRQADYASAAQLYSEAYDAALAATEGASGSLDAESRAHLAVVLSNRAAARISLFDLDLALLDSARAMQLQPGFSRAKAREGEAFTRLCSYGDAHAACKSVSTEAAGLGEDPPTRARYQAAAASAKDQIDARKKEAAHPLLVAAEDSLEFAKRYDKFALDGGETDDLVSASTAVYAWTVMDKAWDVLDTKLKVLESGEVESESPSPVLDIADAIITDARGFHLPPGKDHKLPLSEKLRLQLSWDTQVFELAPHLKKDVVPRDVIDLFDKQMAKEGWQMVKLALAHLIRGSFVAAFINELQGRTLEACSQFRFVLGLLSEGRDRWKDVSEQDLGTSFRFTFERKVKMHLVESIVDGHYRATTSQEREKFSLVEVKGLAEDIMDDCRVNKAPSDPVSTFAFQIQPAVAAGKAFAYTLRDQAQQEENRIDFQAGYFLHPKMMTACARLYSTAGELLPSDDPEKAVNLFNALAFDLRGGGLTIDDLFRRAAKAESALVPPERIFGSSSRTFDSRRLVRTACATARAHLLSPSIGDNGTSKFDLDLTLRPVATVFSSEVPEGKLWHDLVDKEILEVLPGQVPLAEYAVLPK
ncbi:hypothetical protein JCM16303_004065 [Sporobolomyces ruberrimus]